jgi:hypothetical protein
VAFAATSGPVSAQVYWFEDYQKAVELIDEDRVSEAEPLMLELQQKLPVPRVGVRIPGNQYIDYLPYLQLARIHAARGDWELVKHNLDVSEAFGAVKAQRVSMKQFSELRRDLEYQEVRTRIAPMQDPPFAVDTASTKK